MTLPAATVGLAARSSLWWAPTDHEQHDPRWACAGLGQDAGLCAGAFQDDASALGGFGAVAGTSTVFTMDGSTRGGYAGDVVEITDVAAAAGKSNLLATDRHRSDPVQLMMPTAAVLEVEPVMTQQKCCPGLGRMNWL